MSHASRQWRLFCLALLAALVASPVESQTPPLTTISDTVYRADGSPASGVLLIAWPPFTTMGGAPVAAGNKSVTLGANGSMTVQLTPNCWCDSCGNAIHGCVSAYRWDGKDRILVSGNEFAGNHRGGKNSSRSCNVRIAIRDAAICERTTRECSALERHRNNYGNEAVCGISNCAHAIAIRAGGE